MFKPPGYHIDASVSGSNVSPKDVASPSYVYPAGMGGALMNGCYGSGYQERDPCFRFKWPSGICRVKILLLVNRVFNETNNQSFNQFNE